MKQRILRIGFDLDGVIINKPPFIPQFLMEKLVVAEKNKKLVYRFPDTKLEKLLRWLSHHPLLRPPISKNIKLIHELYKSQDYELYVVSSRYSFLEGRTKQWFRHYKLRGLFKKIYINLEDEQPHLFKEKMIGKLNLNVFIDDDYFLLQYLKEKVKNVDFYYMDRMNGIKSGK